MDEQDKQMWEELFALMSQYSEWSSRMREFRKKYHIPEDHMSH